MKLKKIFAVAVLYFGLGALKLNGAELDTIEKNDPYGTAEKYDDPALRTDRFYGVVGEVDIERNDLSQDERKVMEERIAPIDYPTIDELPNEWATKEEWKNISLGGEISKRFQLC